MKEEEPQEEKWVLKPVWTRGTFAVGQMLCGVALSALILGAASRHVRRLYVIPTPPSLLPSSSSTTAAVKAALPLKSAPPLKTKSKHKTSTKHTPRSVETDPLATKSLIVQTSHHLSGRGKLIPLSSCTLRRGRDDTELVLVPEGYTGTFLVDLALNAKVWGREMEMWHMKEAVYKAVYGDAWAKVLNRHGWVDGRP